MCREFRDVHCLQRHWSPQAYEEDVYERLAEEQFDRDLEEVFVGLSEAHVNVFMRMTGWFDGSRHSAADTAKAMEVSIVGAARSIV